MTSVVKVSIIYAYMLACIMSLEAVHTIAAVKVNEDYNSIAEGFSDCFETINEAIANPHVTINGITYNLEFFLCCDYKVSDSVCIISIKLKAFLSFPRYI